MGMTICPAAHRAVDVLWGDAARFHDPEDAGEGAA